MNMKLLVTFLLLIMASLTGVAQSTRSLINDGVDFYADKKYGDAEINFRKSLEKGEQDFISNFNLGDAYFKQEKYEDALKAYQNALARADNNLDKSKSYFNIGNSLLKSNKLKESIEAYKNSLKLNPKDEDAKYNLSYALKLLNDQNQNQDQNKNDKNDQKNDEKKDDQQNNNDKKENKDDKQNQNNQNKQDEQKQNDNQKQNQPQQKQRFSKKEAEAILDAIKNNEKDLQKKLRKKAGVRVKTEKDW